MMSEKPITAFSGVRNSWLIWAMNSDLARSASMAPRSALARRTISLASMGRVDLSARMARAALAWRSKAPTNSAASQPPPAPGPG